MKENAQFFIIFFTDGNESSNPMSKVDSDLQQLNQQMQLLNKQLGIQTTIYAIGFSKYHNANLLNRLAKTGSNLGNFIYIDNYSDDYDE